MKPRRVCLLGPQRLEPTLVEAVRSVGARGALACVTAGWEEREGEIGELADHVECAVHNLEVYGRVEDVFQHDPELFRVLRERDDRMRKVQELYRLRLQHALAAARELLRRTDDPELLVPEQEAAIETVRAIDAQHLDRIHEIHAEFAERWRPGERERVVRHKREIARVLEGVSGLCIAGGHVAILLNRLRLLDVIDLAPRLPIFAWSAGAMVLGERVVVFHDNPPQGAGDAELLEAGLGVCPDVVPLPHASRRLKLEDAPRVALFARRFGDALCVALDARTRLDWDGVRYAAGPGTRRLTNEGGLEELEAA